MSAVTVKAGSNYALPECGFTAPERGAFQAWEINSTAYRAGDSYQANESIEVKVVWHVVEPTTYQVTVTDDGNGTGTATSGTAAAGTEIVLSSTAKGGYHFKEWQVVVGDDISISSGGKFTMPEGNVTVKAVFQVHSYGDWQIGNSEHWRQCSCGAVSEKTDHADSDQDHKCDVCGKTLMDHTVGKATCKKAAVCEICGEEYGDLNPNNHSGKTGGWQKDNGKHWKVYDCCPAARAEEGDHNSVKDAAKAPACMDTGLTEGAHCGTCGEVLTKQETVKALGHD